MALVAALLWLAAVSVARAQGQRVCELSGYCSVGTMPGYIGPLDKADQVKEAFAKSAFEKDGKKELVMFAETRVEPACQFIARYRRAGFGHILPIMHSPDNCAELQAAFAAVTKQPNQGNISCGWYSLADAQGVPYSSEFEYLTHHVGMTAWWKKWFTAARAVALGYNVMAVDQDTLPVWDWYGIVKQPPMSSYTMISQAECDTCINGGFTYVQNANPEGPVAWLLYEAVHRAVRWSEDPAELRAISPGILNAQGQFYIEDQTMLTDAMHSCVAARPVFRIVLMWMKRDDPGWTSMGGVEVFNKFHEALILDHIRDRTIVVEGPASKAVWGQRFAEGKQYPNVTEPQSFEGPLNVTLRSVTLRMPHFRGEWPLAMGGYPFVRQPGPRTAAYRQSFKDLGVPLPPDPEDPATQQRANDTKPELFALTGTWASRDIVRYGEWLQAAWWTSGRHGMWHTALRPRITQGMGHVHGGLMTQFDPKNIVMKYTGHWAWDAAARLNGGPEKVYYATVDEKQPRSTIRKVVAYAPGVIHYKLSKDEFLRAVEQLARVAVTLGAAAAWPAPDCSSEWVLHPDFRHLERPVRHSIPWIYLDTAYTVTPFGDSLEALQCEWTGFLDEGCLTTGGGRARGLLALEFHHLQRRHLAHLPEEQRRPSAENTLQLQAAPSGPPGPFNTAFQKTTFSDLIGLNAELVIHNLRLEYGNPLYLDRLVEVEGLRGRPEKSFAEWRERCRALRYHQLPAGERERWLLSEQREGFPGGPSGRRCEGGIPARVRPASPRT